MKFLQKYKLYVQIHKIMKKMRNVSIHLITILLVIVCLIIAPIQIKIAEENNNTTIYVDNDAEAGWYDSTHVKTIQEGIDNSSTGDTVFVYNGSYFETIIIKKSINLIGENKNSTIINGNNSSYPVLEISAEYVKVSDLTIKNSEIGIYLENTSGSNIIDKNIIKGCSKAIYLLDSHKNLITNNTIKDNNIGISLNLSYKNNFFYNNFINNSKHAKENGENIWYGNKTRIGNYWDNYNGFDKNNDGIGDIPYKLPNGKNKDKFPLMNPYYGKVVKDLYFDLELVLKILVIGIVLSIIFLLPIAYYWRKKYFK